MKNNLLKISAMVITGIFCAYNAQGQTYGAGKLTNAIGACAVPGVNGNCTDTYVGDNSGGSTTNSAMVVDNTFLGAGTGQNNVWATDNTAVGYQSLATQSFGTAAWLSYNTAIGVKALYSNQPTSTSNGYLNSAVGYHALYTNTTGHRNTALGSFAGEINSTGTYNTFLGYEAGQEATGSYNTFSGEASGLWTTGSSNTISGYGAGLGVNGSSNYSYDCIVGYQAANALTTGNENVFMGYQAAYTNSTAANNVILGFQAGYYNNSNDNVMVGEGAGLNVSSGAGSGANTIVGYNAGSTITNKGYNTCIGSSADMAANTYTNSIALGNGASNNIGSNTGYIGNSAYTQTWCAGGLFSVSDARFKINVSENVKGLDFIKKLRPVTYQMDTKSLDAFINQDKPKVVAHTTSYTDSSGTHTTTTYDTIVNPNANLDFTPSTSIIHSGFLAQEVEQAANATGFKSSIVSTPADPSKSNYGINYAEIVVPLVKAVQELSNTVDSLKSVLTPASNQRMENNSGSGTQTDVTLADKKIVLDQNAPNPFHDQTMITYDVQTDFTNAVIMFTDMSGEIIKEVPITAKGKGQLNVYAPDLSSGIYTYYIVVDGKTIFTKKMVKQ